MTKAGPKRLSFAYRRLTKPSMTENRQSSSKLTTNDAPAVCLINDAECDCVVDNSMSQSNGKTPQPKHNALRSRFQPYVLAQASLTPA